MNFDPAFASTPYDIRQPYKKVIDGKGRRARLGEDDEIVTCLSSTVLSQLNSHSAMGGVP